MVWSATLVLLAMALTIAGGIGWAARDQAARQMEAVREDLREADTWQEVYRRTRARQFVLDEDETPPLRLRQGANVVIFKVVNQRFGFEGSLHLVTKDGATPKGIAYRLVP